VTDPNRAAVRIGPLRLAYADPPYPGKAHLYPENTEVDHVELIGRLCEYDGWALSTDETNLRYVLNLCPPKTRVLAWCRSNTPPFQPYPYAAWEPVLCVPARTKGIRPTRSYVETSAALGPQQDGITGQKTRGFCEWLIRCLGAEQGDILDDLFPGTGIMGDTFAVFSSQMTLAPYVPWKTRGPKVDGNMLARVADPLPGFERGRTTSERRRIA
jgi:hypothetical protein